MSPEEFIKKHITDALTAEGFPAEVVRGGQSMVLIITGDALSPVEREACSLTAFFVLVNGPLVRQLWRNVPGERSKRDVRDRAVCFKRRRCVPGLCAG